MNGVLNGDRSPKPQYWEVKKVYQNLYTTVRYSSGNIAELELFNRNYYEPCSYDAGWALVADGEEIRSGAFDTGIIGPREKVVIPLDLGGSLPSGKECYLNVLYGLKEDMPWAEKGYISCEEQMALCQAGNNSRV